MAASGINLPPETFPKLIATIISPSSSWPLAVQTYLCAHELLAMDPLVWVPLDTYWDRFCTILHDTGVSPHQFVRDHGLVQFRKQVLLLKLCLLLPRSPLAPLTYTVPV